MSRISIIVAGALAIAIAMAAAACTTADQPRGATGIQTTAISTPNGRVAACHVHPATVADVRLGNYRILVGIGPRRPITFPRGLAPTGLVGTETTPTATPIKADQLHIEIQPCNRAGNPVLLAAPPRLRLNDPAAGGITLDVALERVRPAGATEAAHYAANITTLAGDRLRAVIAIAGQQATILLLTQSRA